MNRSDREKLINSMYDSVGNQDPIVFFQKMVTVFEEMFNRIDSLEKEVKQAKVNAALAISWDPQIASDLINKQLKLLRSSPDKDLYTSEIDKLKEAYKYPFHAAAQFVDFWVETLGYHPFIDYE